MTNCLAAERISMDGVMQWLAPKGVLVHAGLHLKNIRMAFVSVFSISRRVVLYVLFFVF